MFELKTGVLIVHLVGLAIGLGAATLLDLLIFRYLARDRIAPEHYRMVDIAAKVVTIGLVLLWLSGLGFLARYYVTDPVALTNPKIWAKITIVTILTVNGMYVHKVIVPVIRENIGHPLFYGVSWGRQLMMLAAGAISAISWYVPLAIGAMRELNFTVSATDILIAYGAILLFAVVFAMVIGCLAAQKDLETSFSDPLMFGADLALATPGRVDHAPIEFMTDAPTREARPGMDYAFVPRVAPAAPPQAQIIGASVRPERVLDDVDQADTKPPLERNPLSR